jgi:hypothetical protein
MSAKKWSEKQALEICLSIMAITNALAERCEALANVGIGLKIEGGLEQGWLKITFFPFEEESNG